MDLASSQAQRISPNTRMGRVALERRAHLAVGVVGVSGLRIHRVDPGGQPRTVSSDAVDVERVTRGRVHLQTASRGTTPHAHSHLVNIDTYTAIDNSAVLQLEQQGKSRATASGHAGDGPNALLTCSV